MNRTVRQKRIRPLDAIMAEHIATPGFPQIIVRRGWAYQWFKSLGYDPAERGYGSLDYMIFASEAVEHALTPEDQRDYWLGQVAEEFRR